MTRIQIIDDEIGCCELLHHYLSENFPSLHVLPYGHSVQDGIALISRHHPDILLLDIHLSDGTGFDILDKINDVHPSIIFITAFDQFAIKALQYNAIDYLLKPVDPVAMTTILNKILESNGTGHLYQRIQNLLEDKESNNLRFLTFATHQDIRRVRINEILRIYGEGNYTTIFLQNGEKFTVTRSMKELEDLLEGPDFFRPHQSHLIQMDRVSRVLREDGGIIMMENGDAVPLSRRRKDAFMELFLNN